MRTLLLSSSILLSGKPQMGSFIVFIDSSLVTRALIENPNLIRWSLFLKAFSGLLALICGNGYIVGINQIYDVGIDK